ncbi:MFS general substrate transporter [Delitschia confertaspora ATCC 74209]|uniref:MFS general substrate transporter n=1 Tax=Delitschia confertaspora ATCC 74209 TaxID=1513339 RepID=A0A9P4MTM1_9PLEO|nr:MFS general substrate transporter [Delitschia confertaspora ATCC 74209]
MEVPNFSPDWRFKAAFGTVMFITLMAALDATSLSVALPTIADAVHGSAIEAFWSGTSFLLTSTVFQPSIGSFSTIFGRKPLLLFSVITFGIGAVVAGAARSITVVLIGRSVQGVGGGGIIALSEILITDMVPLRERGKWHSLQSGMWSLGTVIGPLLGGGFAEKVSWRWLFYINLPFVGLGIPLIIYFLRLRFPVSSLGVKLKRVDWVGSVLFIASTTGFLIPLTWGGVQYHWDSWRTLMPLVLCGIGLIFFVVYEEYWATDPLILMSVFKNRTSAATYLQNVIHGIVLWCLMFYLPLYYEAVKGFSPTLAAVSLFPQSFTVAPAAAIVGITIAKTGRYRWAVWSGWFLTTFGTGLLIFFDVNTPTAAWTCMSLVGGVGFGILFPAMALALQAATKPEDQAYAVTVFTFLRAFGQTIGVAVGGVVFQNQIRKKLLTFPALAGRANELSKDATALVRIIQHSPQGEMKEQLKKAYVFGLKHVWIVMTVLAFTALVSTLFVEGLSLDQALKTDQGFQYSMKTPAGEDGKMTEDNNAGLGYELGSHIELHLHPGSNNRSELSVKTGGAASSLTSLPIQGTDEVSLDRRHETRMMI